jgi:hypothetical protein
MRKSSVRTIGAVALLVTSIVAGCGREQTAAVVPVVISTVPANGAAAVPVAQVISATFNKAMSSASVTNTTFTVTGPGGAPVSGAVTYTGTTASFTPAVVLAPTTLYTATITTGATDLLGIPLAADFVWSFTTGTVPRVISTVPLNGATNVPLNQKIIASFSEEMNPATITAAGAFTVAVSGGGPQVTGTVSYVAGANTAIFAPGTSLTASTHYTATITTAAQSAAGNALASNYAWSFTTGIAPNSTPPIVISTVPASGAVDVPTNTILTATFSKVMDPATITAAGTFTLAIAGPDGAAVAGTVQYAGTSATFTPASILPVAMEFTATITTAAEDLTGNALAADFSWNFTTGAGPDTTPPTITLTIPADAATGIALSQSVNATFSEPMNPATILAPGTFSLTVAGTDGAPVSGAVSYDAINNIATFTPLANLTASSSYTAKITNAATDAAGNPLADGTTPNPWTFTTGTATDQPAPNLGTAASFGSLGGAAGITNQGTETIINGDIGTTGASTLVTGFNDSGPGCIYTETPLNVGFVSGAIDTAPPSPTVGCPTEGTAATLLIATNAAADAQAAYISISPAAMPGGTDPGAGQLALLTLPPGVYKAAAGSFMITGGDLTLDAGGDINAVWIFQMSSSLTVGDAGTPRNVMLIDGAQAKNVFWQVGSMATINPSGGGTMVGTIIAFSGVTFSTAGNAAVTTLNGRALALDASVTMVNTVVNVPAP